MKTLIKIFVINYFTYLIFALFYIIYSGFKGMLEEVMDTDLFRFSEFENYRVVRSLEDLE